MSSHGQPTRVIYRKQRGEHEDSIASALAAATLAVGPLALGAGATASTQGAPTRTVGAEVVQVRGHLVMQGKVSDGYANKLVYIQKKTLQGRALPLEELRQGPHQRHAKYKHGVTAPRRGSWYWRAKVKASGGFAESYSVDLADLPRLTRGQATVHVSPPPMSPVSRSARVPPAAASASLTWARAWSS